MDPITLFAAATASAVIFGGGNHQPDGFRDTGCDPAAQVAVRSERTGEILYYNNSTCPTPTGPSDAPASSAVAAVEAPSDPENGDNGNGSNGNGNGENGGPGNGNGNGHGRD